VGSQVVTLSIRALEISIETAEGAFGCALRFERGLVVIRGDNASGKTTCLSAILYGLGLEALFIRSQDSPFPESMTKRLKDGDKWIDVISSAIRLECEGHDGMIITTRRSVTGETTDRQLVNVAFGPELTDPVSNGCERRDYFVRIPGAAQSEAGFHTFLADFIGWKLPLVPRYDGPPVPLYLETIFPLVFVDQLRGWTGLASRMPTHFKIVDVWQSSIEFVLRLDIQAQALMRHNLQAEAARIKEEWSGIVAKLTADASGVGVNVGNIPPEPPEDIEVPEPRLLVTEGDDWLTIEQALASRRLRLTHLEEREIPRIEQIEEDLRESVAEAEGEVDRLEEQHAAVVEEIKIEQQELVAVTSRLQALQDDRRKYKDEQRLRQLGAPGNLRLATTMCPYCKQSLKDTLLPQGAKGEPMTLEDNLRFIEGQIGLFDDIRIGSMKILRAKQQRLIALRQRISDAAGAVRERKRVLRGDAQAPSSAAIRERLLEEDRIERLQALSQRVVESGAALDVTAARWRETKDKLRVVSTLSLSEGDREKLTRVESYLIDQLRAYGFKSFDPEQVKLSADTYRPTREGVDLPNAVQMAASDAVRLIWGYLVALLEVSRTDGTHHPGIVIFDEPQQQHMKEVSFEALLQRVAPCRDAGQQAIIATSEARESLSTMLEGISCQLIDLPERVLQRIR
jgi:AAA domain